MAHLIEDAQENGIGYAAGLRKGDEVISINGEQIIDDIDYQALTANKQLSICVKRRSGKTETLEIEKDEWEPLGLRMAESLVCKPRVCFNHCVFCFIDQMPPHMRKSLYVKDDDWRLSLMMGNFVTLTNVDEQEFERIVRRKASPLYISVHTTNMPLRARMMGNPNATMLMERLKRLKEAGLRFHCQVVLCPGLNDGEELDKTLSDLAHLYPAAQSVALVPVGLTKFREGLAQVSPYGTEGAKRVLDAARTWQKKCLRDMGTRFVFPADEFYCIAGEEVPEEEEYEGYPQIENGVGMLRQFEEDMKYAAGEAARDGKKAAPRRVLIACGTSVAPVMEGWLSRYAPDGITWRVQPIKNNFFGQTVTVTGLLVGRDLKEQLLDADADEILISASTLRNEGDLFLDDMSKAELAAALPCPVTFVQGGGEGFFQCLMGERSKE